MGFYRVRHAELHPGLAATEQRIGIRITEENIGEVLQGTMKAIRRFGNPALADKYLAGYDNARRALKTLGEFVALQAERILTDIEGAQMEAAQEAVDEAAEEFERVVAEASAYLDSLDDQKGGA
jgi:hypothetical protein